MEYDTKNIFNKLIANKEFELFFLESINNNINIYNQTNKRNLNSITDCKTSDVSKKNSEKTLKINNNDEMKKNISIVNKQAEIENIKDLSKANNLKFSFNIYENKNYEK